MALVDDSDHHGRDRHARPHPRPVPLLLPEELWDEWLDPGLSDVGDVDALIARIPEPHLTPVKVAAAVGNVRNNGPELVRPVE